MTDSDSDSISMLDVGGSEGRRVDSASACVRGGMSEWGVLVSDGMAAWEARQGWGGVG